MTNAELQVMAEFDVTEADLKPKEVSQMDIIEAQVLYTALMTDTLIEE